MGLIHHPVTRGEGRGPGGGSNEGRGCSETDGRKEGEHREAEGEQEKREKAKMAQERYGINNTTKCLAKVDTKKTSMQHLGKGR